MAFIYSFEKLEVWNNARDFVKQVYKLSNNFPEYEKYGLTSQIQRASVSIVSNIAEGASRFSSKDQARFYEIAYASLTEVYCQLIIASDLDYIKIDEIELLKPQISKDSNQINALRKSCLSKQ